MAAGALGGPPERVPDHPLHAVRRVDALLGGDLMGGAAAQRAAGAGVRPLRALADDHQVDLRSAGQRRADAGIEAHRPQIDVVVEGKAQGQQQPAFQHPGRHRRIPDRAEQDRVVPAQLLEDRERQGLPGRVVAAGTEVVLGDLDPGPDGVEHLAGFSDDLRPDAVPRQHCDGCHE